MTLRNAILTSLSLLVFSCFCTTSAPAKETEKETKAESTETKAEKKSEKKKPKKKKKKKKKLTELDYLLGDPDRSLTFPAEAFDQAKELKKEKRLEEAEDLMLNHLELARKAGKGTTKLGKYLIRLNNILFARGKDKAAIKYGEIGVKLLAKDYAHAKELSGWLVNGQSYLAMSYSRQKKYKKAIKNFEDAIQSAETAPEGKVSPAWIKSLKQQRRDALRILRKKASS